MDDERCATCINWKRAVKHQKHGWCHAWQPWDYHQKRGRGSSKFIGYWNFNGVASDEDQWCARWKEIPR